jgi:hypothetical protein
MKIHDSKLRIIRTKRSTTTLQWILKLRDSNCDLLKCRAFEFTRSAAWKCSNLLHNTWNEVWWINGSLNGSRSGSKQKLHLHLHEHELHFSSTNSAQQTLISTKSKLRNKNLKLKCHGIWKKIELWMREKIWVREKFESWSVKNDSFPSILLGFRYLYGLLINLLIPN